MFKRNRRRITVYLTILSITFKPLQPEMIMTGNTLQDNSTISPHTNVCSRHFYSSSSQNSSSMSQVDEPTKKSPEK